MDDGPAAVPSAPRALAVGLLGGLALGIVARGWMRLISEDPEFSWGGTLFIVLGFGFFATAQAVVVVVRRRTERRSRLAGARAAGIVGILPLFVAAGAIMFPTVTFGGLALGQVTWPKPVRVVGGAIALAPVGLVGAQLVDAFGWSLRTVAGMLGLLAVYALILVIARPTFSPPPGQEPLPRWAHWSMVGAGGLVLLSAVGIGSVE